ncbi:hypothetical protein J2801_002896 [Paraburkholderia phenoliruptrix]|uniref:MARCKS-like protein n=1 Tax=Paraburkholderia phenoliruptrix TaxID=252970 RepID=UPI00285AF086|nr:MARCKS-like protein [Paraburkholderia phenoliruptrix]MDR6420615.1 hypothetical protein [Paraburkholderia phenoliruptrix]
MPDPEPQTRHIGQQPLPGHTENIPSDGSDERPENHRLEDAAPTPPRQTPNDPTAGDRHLSDEQNQSARDEPAPPDPGRGADLPDPNEVGEDG